MPRTRRLPASAVAATVVLLVAALTLAPGGRSAFGAGGAHATAAGTVVHTLDPSTHGNPEGVTVDGGSGAFFVGTVDDGTIYRGTLGAPTLTPYIRGGAGRAAVGMKAVRGRLYVAGGATGKVFVYGIASKALVATFDTGSGGFLNDLVVTPRGDVWVTDSFRPTLWRITAAVVAAGTGTPQGIPVGPEIAYGGGFNLNGIVALDGGRRLLVVQTSTGALFRVTPARDGSANRRIVRVAAPAVPGDGMALDRGRLLVVTGRPAQVVVLRLTSRRRAVRVRAVTDPTLEGPSTIAVRGRRWLVVNADFATSTRPFTVSDLVRRG